MKTSYHIGEMAAYFGVSTDTLRLYDRKGILSPRKEESGYRVYSREDMIFLDYIMRLRRLGLPLREIKRLVDQASILEAEQTLEAQSRALLDRVEELRALYGVTRDYLGALRQTREDLGEMRVCMSPRMIVRPIEDSFISAAAAFEELGPGLVPRFCTLTSPEDMLVERYEVKVYDYELRCAAQKNAVVVIDAGNNIKVPEQMRDKMFVLPPRKCAYTAARCRSGVDYEDYIRLRSFIIESGYKITGDMISVFIAVRCGPRGKDDFYQIYIPIA